MLVYLTFLSKCIMSIVKCRSICIYSCRCWFFEGWNKIPAGGKWLKFLCTLLSFCVPSNIVLWWKRFYWKDTIWNHLCWSFHTYFVIIEPCSILVFFKLYFTRHCHNASKLRNENRDAHWWWWCRKAIKLRSKDNWETNGEKLGKNNVG